MPLNTTTTELLSPAGSFEALIAAVQNGADAVYLGGTAFSARAGAGNFDNDALERAVKYAHVRGVKVFVTLNTLIKQSELSRALEFAQFVYEKGVDAVIIQDLGLASLIKKAIPNLALHASTQMTIHNVAGAKMLEKLGFKRVVLARELTHEQIKQIKEQTKLELEIFVHGAICQSYSGQCLLSSILGGRSGNRGRCAQPCRLPYELKKENKSLKKGYLLSPKDMCLLSHISQIKKMGIDSLKIEGRLKRAEYVATVTRIYRKYLDEPKQADNNDIQTLLNAFNRSGFTDGYYTKRTGADMMSFKSGSNISDEKFDKDIKNTFAENANFRRVKVEGIASLKTGRRAEFTLKDADGNVVTSYGEEVKEASNTPLSYERVYAQLSKFGSVPFELTDLKLEMDDNVTLAVSEINALRRSACDMLIKTRENTKREETGASSIGYIIGKNNGQNELVVEARTYEQAMAVLAYEPDMLCAPQSVIKKIGAYNGKTQLVVKTDAIINNENEGIYENISTDAISCSSIAQLYALKEKHKLYGDYRLNVYNEASIGFYLENGFDRVTLSPELSLKDISLLSQSARSVCDVLVYGHLPLMTMKNCVIKASGGKCDKGADGYYLTDRKNERFHVLCQSQSCTNLLLNSKPIYMADKLYDLLKIGIKRFVIMFTIEDAQTCGKICEQYLRAMHGEKVKNIIGENNFTRAHFYRGVI